MIEYSHIKERFPVYQEKILEITKKKLYAYDRYGIEFSALMLYSDEPIQLDACNISTRQSDNVFYLEENLYVVIYDGIKPENSTKPAQNILRAYHHYSIKQKLYLLVAQAEKEYSAEDMVNCLFSMLEYAVKEGHPNTVIDMHQINCHRENL